MRFTQNPGRVAGVLYLLTSIVGFFALGYVPRYLIVDGNATATAGNIAAHETLFRLGIAGELIGQAGFIFVALALFELFKGVNRRQAWLMVILIVLSVPIAFLNELNALAALVLVRGADFLTVFDKPQRNALAMLFIDLHGQGFAIAELFWGLWLFPLALLVYRSRFLPRFLGVWLAIAGVAWVMLSLSGILLPQYQDQLYTLSQPAFFGEIAFMLWLVIKGATPHSFDAQPVLRGDLLEVRPLRPEDYDDLYAVASDPLIWEQHPNNDRHEDRVFREFFREALASGGGLIILDSETGKVIGSSRFHGYDPNKSEVEIGWTFLARSHWGGRYNAELKRLMLEHAFRFVRSVVFLIGPHNLRSQRAVEKIGAVRAGSRRDGNGRESYVYQITR